MSTTTNRATATASAARRARRLCRRRGRDPRRMIAPRVARGPRRRRSEFALGWRELVLGLLDHVELEVLDYPEECSQVQAVRSVVCAQLAGQPLPAIDPRCLAFTIGLIAAAAESDFSDYGLASLCLRLLSPSALAEYERAKGFRVSPPSRW